MDGRMKGYLDQQVPYTFTHVSSARAPGPRLQTAPSSQPRGEVAQGPVLT